MNRCVKPSAAAVVASICVAFGVLSSVFALGCGSRCAEVAGPPEDLRFAIELDVVAGGEKLTRVRSRRGYFANISSTVVIVTSAALMPSGYAAISLSSFATAAGFGVA